MKYLKIALCAGMIGVGAAALAADLDSDAARQQRMDEALQNYRQGGDHDRDRDGRYRHDRRDRDGRAMDRRDYDPRNPNPGPAARAEMRMKHGARKAGHSIQHGAEKVGHAVGTGMRKTGKAIRHAGEKVEDKVDSKR